MILPSGNRSSRFVFATAFGLFVPAGASTRQNPSIDPKAAILLREVDHATRAANSIQAKLTVTRVLESRTERLRGGARLQRPAYAKVELKGRLGQTIAADGKRIWVYNASTDQYLKRKSDGTEDLAKTFGPLIPLALFFDPSAVTAKTPRNTRITLEPPVTRAGVRYDVIGLIAPAIEIRLFIAPTRVVHRSITTALKGGKTSSIDVELSGIVLNRVAPAKSFAYQPPGSARELPGPIQVEVVQPSVKQKP